ncbi:MAG TPA: Maf family protein [Pyrinomonadaceae bacterium]|nr:Maf family protein [Pyrinomonadaceae bacterium]
MEKLILASSSPRRAEILNAVHWPFEPVPANIDESRWQSEEALPYVKRLAETKARTVAARFSSGLVLGADTVVVVGAEILGQPREAKEARRMLKLLSGKWHEVITGVSLVRAENGQALIDHEITRVRVAELSDDEIDWYVETGEPLDKAGAYAIQGRAGVFIEEIDGDYFNIVGLPVRLVYELAQRMRRDRTGSVATG